MSKRIWAAAAAIAMLTGVAHATEMKSGSTGTTDSGPRNPAMTMADCEKMSGAKRDACMRDMRDAKGMKKDGAMGKGEGSSMGANPAGKPSQPNETQPGTSRSPR